MFNLRIKMQTNAVAHAVALCYTLVQIHVAHAFDVAPRAVPDSMSVARLFPLICNKKGRYSQTRLRRKIAQVEAQLRMKFWVLSKCARVKSHSLIECS